MKKRPEELSRIKENSPRNSQLREYVQKPAQELARILHSVFPWLTPNDVTVLGSLGLVGLVVYTAQLEKDGRIDTKTGMTLLACYFTLSGTDLIDGTLARYLQSAGVEYTGKKNGALIDSTFDRIQEAFSAWLAMYRAAQQKDKLWLVTATLSALTNPLSSLVRAYAEKEGIVVAESGKNLFEFFGTRAGRFAAGTLHYLPKVKILDTSLQAVVDGLIATATIKTTASRVEAIVSTQSIQTLEHGEKTQKDLVAELKTNAKERFRLLLGLTVITSTVTGILLFKLLKEGKKTI